MSGVEPGVPQPPKGPIGPEYHREHERPSSVAYKRIREWEDEPSIKKPANEEKRARLDDVRHRRPSTPLQGNPYRRSPDAHRFEEQRRIDEQRHAEEQRRVDDMRRADEQRHGNEGYHPSEAAHHPPAHAIPPPHLPPMQQGPSPMPGPLHERLPPTPAKEYPPPPQEERARLEHPPAPPAAPQVNEPERAARKMDVDEDYDDSGEEEKKVNVGGPSSGAGPASATELKTSTPTSAGGLNGLMGPAAKAESAA